MTAALIQGVLNRYLQKYLKNVTTEHATVWGGQLVFKNLEFNLDALQEEIGLPVVFQRGFIQELRVFLPIANLLREHISITFSNVEIIACTPETFEVPSKAQGPGKAKAHGAKAKEEGKGEGIEEEEQEGWVRSLLSRVTLNIKVELRNVVFKYVTESYVSSVSFKSLSVLPTNSLWQHLFSDFQGLTKASFKEIQIEDATWCLDTVESDGKVHRFQPPIFNREGMTLRVISRKLPDGPKSHADFPFRLPATQVDMRSTRICLTLSDSQLGMLMKLVNELDDMYSKIKQNNAQAKRQVEREGLDGEGGDEANEDDKLLNSSQSNPKQSGNRKRVTRLSKRTWIGSFFGSASHLDDQDEEPEPDSSLYNDSVPRAGSGSGLDNLGSLGKLLVDSVVTMHVGDFAMNLTRSSTPPSHAKDLTKSWGSFGREEKVQTSVFIHTLIKDAFCIARSSRALCLTENGWSTKVIDDVRAGVRSFSVDYVDFPCTKGFFQPINPSTHPLDLDQCLLAASLFRTNIDEDDKYLARPNGEDIKSEGLKASIELESLFLSSLVTKLNQTNASPGDGPGSEAGQPKAVDREAYSNLRLVIGNSTGQEGGLDQIPEPRAKEGAWPPNQPLFISCGMSTIVHRPAKKEEEYLVGLVHGSSFTSLPQQQPVHSRPPMSPQLMPKDHTANVQTPCSPNSIHHEHPGSPGASQQNSFKHPPPSTPASLKSDGSRKGNWEDEDGAEGERRKKDKGVQEGILMQLSMAPFQLFVHPRLMTASSAYFSPQQSTTSSSPSKDHKSPFQKSESNKTGSSSSKHKVGKMLEQVPKVMVTDIRIAHLSCSYAALDLEDAYCEGTRSAVCFASDAIHFSNLVPHSNSTSRPSSQSPSHSSDDSSSQRFGGLMVGVKFGHREVMIRGGEVHILPPAPHWLNNRPVRFHLHASLEHATFGTTRNSLGSTASPSAASGLMLLSMTMEDMDLSMTYADIQALLSSSVRKNVYSASGGASHLQSELISITVDPAPLKENFEDLMTIQLRGGAIQGQASVNGMQGAMKINRIAIKSKFMDLELPVQDELIQVSSNTPEAAFVVEGFLPWSGNIPENEAVSLCRASGLGASTGKLLASGMRGRVSMSGAKFLGSAAELLPLVQLVAIRAAMEGDSYSSEKRRTVKSESELSLNSKIPQSEGHEDGEAWNNLQDAMAQVRELQRENEYLKERYSAAVAERHSAMTNSSSDKVHPSGRGTNGREADNSMNSQSGSHGQHRRMGLGKVGGKMVNKGYWCWKRSRGGSDVCRCLKVECGNVIRAIQMRPAVAGLLLYTLALHFVIAYLMRELSRKHAAPSLNSSKTLNMSEPLPPP